jgi:hypothetical protein
MTIQIRCAYCDAGIRGDAYVYNDDSVVHPICRASDLSCAA